MPYRAGPGIRLQGRAFHLRSGERTIQQEAEADRSTPPGLPVVFRTADGLGTDLVVLGSPHSRHSVPEISRVNPGDCGPSTDRIAGLSMKRVFPPRPRSATPFPRLPETTLPLPFAFSPSPAPSNQSFSPPLQDFLLPPPARFAFLVQRGILTVNRGENRQHSLPLLQSLLSTSTDRVTSH